MSPRPPGHGSAHASDFSQLAEPPRLPAVEWVARRRTPLLLPSRRAIPRPAVCAPNTLAAGLLFFRGQSDNACRNLLGRTGALQHGSAGCILIGELGNVGTAAAI